MVTIPENCGQTKSAKLEVNRYLRRPDLLLLLLAAAVPFSFSTWQALLNNFVVERAAFTGTEIGILQSLREVPGFLSFAVVLLLVLYFDNQVNQYRLRYRDELPTATHREQ